MERYNMKKIVALLIVLTIFACPVFPMLERTYAAENNEEKQDSTFQKLSDLINGKYEVKTIPCKKIRTFQRLSDCINAVRRSSE